MDYCTLAELKRKLKRPDSADVYNDSYLNEAISRASRIVDTFTNSFFYEKTLTNIVLDRYNIINNYRVLNNTIFLNSPITNTVSTVIIEDGTTLTENIDYYQYDSIGAIEKNSGWSINRKSIDLTCSLGHTAIPTDITSSTLEIAQILTGLGVQVIQGDDGDVEGFISNKIPSIIKKTLTKYKFVVTL